MSKRGVIIDSKVKAEEKGLMDEVKKEISQSEGSDAANRKVDPGLLFPKKEVSDDSTEEVSFKEQLIGYILDEMDNGFSIDQIKDALIDQGYEEDEIAFGIDYVNSRFKKRIRNKKISDKSLMKQRFILPAVGIFLLVFAVMMVVFTMDGAKQIETQEKIDYLQFHKLGLDPGTDKIFESSVLTDLSFPVDTRKVQAFLNSREGEYFDSLQVADSVTAIHKRITTFATSKGNKTLVELRFSVSRPTDSLKLLEVIPKRLVSSSDSIITDANIIDTDPILEWSFAKTSPTQLIVKSYVVKESLESFTSSTYPMVQKAPKPSAKTVCGNSICEVGESYLSCCSDCGCLPGFECSDDFCQPIKKETCQSDAGCDDFDPSTRDYCGGAPKICRHEPLCFSGDGTCPSTCGYQNDTDCPPPTQEYLEKSKFVLNKSIPPWHPDFICTDDWMCIDGDSCTTDVCNLESGKCYWEDITECIDNDQCCPASCTELDDDDC